ncbi:heptaprenyl diphosphate synthase component 1 [Bacillus sp. REN10]|uniref:heptaprenyl diphosphate synthase component 1 n=1 Tax=Bacillus sp. REN10 TaxID=2782541 RepID=UPI00193AE213|nr:heptaprenyl diphosphate synthase component 1 [Bacillus sp. REN10]
MNEWLQQKSLIEKEVQYKLSYPYLRKYIDKPDIDETRLEILMFPFNTERLSSSETKQYITTATLIQIALDTHEKVTASSSDIIKEQQLTVLAGDYFSGLYYQILADLNDVHMIRTLADAVKSINENKIALYQKERYSIEAIMESVYKIETEIVERFYRFFDVQYLFSGVSHVLFVKRLLKEKEAFFAGEKAIVIDSLKQMKFPEVKGSLSMEQQQSLFDICEEYIRKARTAVEQMLSTELVHEPILHLFEKMSAEFFGNKTYVEEG